MANNQKELAELKVAAKSCKVSAEDARRIKAEIAANKRDLAATMEQRQQVAILVEKREMLADPLQDLVDDQVIAQFLASPRAAAKAPVSAAKAAAASQAQKRR